MCLTTLQFPFWITGRLYPAQRPYERLMGLLFVPCTKFIEDLKTSSSKVLGISRRFSYSTSWLCTLMLLRSRLLHFPRKFLIGQLLCSTPTSRVVAVATLMEPSLLWSFHAASQTYISTLSCVSLLASPMTALRRRTEPLLGLSSVEPLRRARLYNRSFLFKHLCSS